MVSTEETSRDSDIGRVLAAAAELTRQVRRMRTSPFAGDALSGTQVDALFLLARAADGMTPSALAEALGVTAGAVTQLVDLLAERSLVTRRAHPDDARSRLLLLTDDARARVSAFEAEVRAHSGERFATLDDAALSRLADQLERVVPPER